MYLAHPRISNRFPRKVCIRSSLLDAGSAILCLPAGCESQYRRGHVAFFRRPINHAKPCRCFVTRELRAVFFDATRRQSVYYTLVDEKKTLGIVEFSA